MGRAVAIEAAAVRTAVAAELGEAVPKDLAGPVEPNSRAIHRGSVGLGDLGQGDSLEIRLSQDFGILRFQGGEDLPPALADAAREFGDLGRRGFRGELRLPPERSDLDRVMAVVVGHGVPKESIKPRDRTLRVPDLRAPIERLRIGGLENVLGRLGGCDPGSQELQELIPGVRQDSNGLVGGLWFHAAHCTGNAAPLPAIRKEGRGARNSARGGGFLK